jgi:hypothetical protein
MSVDDFFNLEVPCDCSIRDCVVLRNDYRVALENLNATGCSECQKNALKMHFIRIITEKDIAVLPIK